MKSVAVRTEHVIVTLFGGLGNQLFQYAAGLTIAREANAELLVYEKSDVGLPGFLDIAVKPMDQAVLRRSALATPEQRSLFRRVTWQIHSEFNRLSGTSVMYRQNSAFDSRTSSPPLPTSKYLGLHGYFQHPSWFESTLEFLIQSLGAKVDLESSPLVHDRLNDIGEYTIVSFRRGDYLRSGSELPLGHYQRAIDVLPSSGGPLIIVSDDELISKFGEVWFAERGFEVIPQSHFGDRGRIRDLTLLSRATQVVMANSTFCWWGTVLGDVRATETTTTRHVVAPKQWLKEPLGAEALVRPEWIAI